MQTVRNMNYSDLKAVTLVHMKSFSGFFLTIMGADFLEKFYAAVMHDSSHITYVFVDDGKITGFVAGTTRPIGIYRRLLLHFGFYFVLASLQPILRKPVIVLRLFNRFLFSSSTDYDPNDALLMSIAVSPECEGRGVGHALVKAFIDESRKREVKKIYLTTDKNNNERVNQFYKNAGFELVRSFSTRENREMNEYRMLLVD